MWFNSAATLLLSVWEYRHIKVYSEDNAMIISLSTCVYVISPLFWSPGGMSQHPYGDPLYLCSNCHCLSALKEVYPFHWQARLCPHPLLKVQSFAKLYGLVLN